MRVILLQDVSNVGKKNEVKDVSDGFARNFLLAKNLAKPASPEGLKSLEMERARKEKESTETRQKYKTVVEKLESLTLRFKVKMGEKDKAFGSVSSARIRDALKKQGIVVEKEEILLDEPIKTTGERIVEIKFPGDLTGKIKVVVEPEN